MAAGGKAEAAACDITDHDAVNAAVGAVVARHGRVDVLVNNAGWDVFRLFKDSTPAEWQKLIAINLVGPLNMHHAVLPGMLAQGGGVIVNNASVLGWRAQAGQSHYAAAKAGVMALTRCSAVEAAPHGVRINAVSPSLAVHPFLNKVMADEELAVLASREVFGRGAEVWEVANVIAFLASDYATFMTGEVVSVSSQHA